jgi:GNAT superfamily N-acetyltransferase
MSRSFMAKRLFDIKEQIMAQDFTFTTRLATPADVDSLTELHCTSFSPEENVLAMLGKRYVRAVHRWQVSDKKAYTFVAESEGRIIGFLSRHDGPYTWSMFMACLGEFLLSMLKNPLLVFNKALWQRLFRRAHSADDSWNRLANYPGVERGINGAVDAEFRGKGVFTALLEASKTVAESRGTRAILGSVYKRNRAMQRAQVKAGFVMTGLETSDTVTLALFLDPTLPEELGIALPDAMGE